MGATTPQLSETADDAATPAGRGDRRSVLLLAGALVAALALVVVLWGEERDAAHDADLRAAEAAATSAASDIAVSMTSYDHRTVDHDFAWVQGDGTASFQRTYAKSTEPIRRLVEQTQAHAEGTVTDAAGTADDPTHVTVLLFVDQALRHQGDRKAEIDSSRVVMSMVLQDGRWLVDDVELR